MIYNSTLSRHQRQEEKIVLDEFFMTIWILKDSHICYWKINLYNHSREIVWTIDNNWLKLFSKHKKNLIFWIKQ